MAGIHEGVVPGLHLVDRCQGHLLLLAAVETLLVAHVLVGAMLSLQMPAVSAVFQAWHQIFAFPHDARQGSDTILPPGQGQS